MAPSEIPTTSSGVGEKPDVNGKRTKYITTQRDDNAGKTTVSKTSNDSNPNPKVAETASDTKLSNAELKKRQKADKAARRVQEKQNQQPKADIALPDKGQAGKEKIRRGSEVSKAQNKIVVSSQKALPARSVQPSLRAPATESKKESKDVALFGHLYGHPRRTTIAGASKDVHPTVLALGLQMSNYVICGSSARCVATLLVFKRVIESYITPPQNSLPRHLNSHLSSQIDYLVSCRPLSVSMGNAIRWLKLEISNVDPNTPESEAKADLCSSIDSFIRERITVAGQVIASSSAEKIKHGDVILTYGKSSVVQHTLLEAYQRGTRFKVIVVDSRPLFEGKNLARSLANLGLEVQYALTHSISHVVYDATKVFLGAHAMMSNGRLYSRVGTALVAMMAKEADIPVIVCCESIKFTDKVALDSIVNNEIAPPDELILQGNRSSSLDKWRDTPNLQLLNLMYDVTPTEYIDMVITEYGSLPPSSVPVVHRLSTNT